MSKKYRKEMSKKEKKMFCAVETVGLGGANGVRQTEVRGERCRENPNSQIEKNTNMYSILYMRTAKGKERKGEEYPLYVESV